MKSTSDASFRKIVSSSLSIAEVIRELGRAMVGSSYKLVHKEVARLQISTTHFKGQAHGTSIQNNRTPHKMVFSRNSPSQNGVVKRRILKKQLLDYVCSTCRRGPVWEGKPLVLRLDHKNGVRRDSRLSNLRFLCPNCDSQSEHFCGRNKPKAIHKVKPPKPRPTKIEWPDVATLTKMVVKSSFVSVGRGLGVSDVAVKKRLCSRTLNG